MFLASPTPIADRSICRAGFGGLVCCAKPEERELWAGEHGYAAQTGRTQSLLVVEADGPHCFNFLKYELLRLGQGAGQTESLVNLFSVILEIAEGKTEVGGGRDPFWERASRQLLRNAIDLLSLARGSITLDDLAKLIAEAPQHAAPPWPPEDAQGNELDAADWTDAQREYGYWLENSFFAEVFAEVHVKKADGQLTRRQAHDFDAAARYWLHNFATMNDRTRSSIVTTFTSTADILTHGLAWELLAEELTIIPEAAVDAGAIIVLDLPLQDYGETGRIIQGIWKYMFQRAMLRRRVKEKPRPVFLWCDESQNFISSFDYEFQATARSARAATVYLTQNISNYHAKLGGNGHAAALALLGNFQTKIWHANGDYVTNQYAADTIGQHLVRLEGESFGASIAEQATGSYNQSYSQQLQYKILPAEFAKLRKGGPDNDLTVDGVIFQGGRVFKKGGDTYLHKPFKQ